MKRMLKTYLWDWFCRDLLESDGV